MVAPAASVLCAPPLSDATAAIRKTAGRHGRTFEPSGPERGTRFPGSQAARSRGRPARLDQALSGARAAERRPPPAPKGSDPLGLVCGSYPEGTYEAATDG
jgi:hypothetical protein